MTTFLSKFRQINLVLTGAGAALFGFLFLYVTLAPEDFDQRTRAFALVKMEGKIDEQLANLAGSSKLEKVTSFAGKYSETLEHKMEAMQASLDGGIAPLLAGILADTCELDCDQRAAVEEAITEIYENSILKYGFALDRVQNLVVGKYDETMSELRLDLRIFTGSSFAVLAFAFLLALFKGQAAAHLLPFSIVLTLSTVFAASWYALGQDWVTTIIFSSYWGWGYSVLLGIISLFLADIALFKAQITTNMINSIGNIFGEVNLSPC